jgi:hypothetical protein
MPDVIRRVTGVIRPPTTMEQSDPGVSCKK